MAQAFRRKGDRFVARMDPAEVAVLAGLMDQTRALLHPDVTPTGDPFTDLVSSMEHQPGPGDGAPAEARDPALRRLLPDAHRGDPEIAAEFRRLTEQSLRQRKYANLTTALEALAEAGPDGVTLTRPQAEAVLVALTDTRLLLGERLGLRTEEDTERLARELATGQLDDPAGYAVAVYDFLTWLQDSLTRALMGRRMFR